MEPRSLTVGRALLAIAQNGLTFAKDPFDRERYTQVRELAAELVAHGSNVGPEAVLDLAKTQTGYATPKVDVRGAVFRDGEILLVKERSDGGWTLPGGWVDVGESPSQAVEKEIREESGYTARAVKLLSLVDKLRHDHPPDVTHAFKLFFLCELTGGSAQGSIETSEVGFFAEDALPNLSTPRVTRGQLLRMFEHLRHPDWPTDFD